MRESAASLERAKKELACLGKEATGPHAPGSLRMNLFLKLQDKTIAVNHGESSEYSCHLFSVPLKSTSYFWERFYSYLICSLDEIPSVIPVPESHYLGHWGCCHSVVINILVDACMSARTGR